MSSIREGICPQCHSREILANAETAEQDTLAVQLYEEAGVQRRGRRTFPIKAWICTHCGYTEFYVTNPRTWRAPTDVRWNRWPDEALSDVRRLPEDGVHVWRIGLDVPATRLAGLGAYLTPEEMARAGRYRFPAPRRRFVAARGLLRELLGAYLELDPARLRFRQNAWGKPLLLEPPDALQFNVTHTDDLALIAVSAGNAVGIDVERIRPLAHPDRLAACTFSPLEYAAFRELPPSQQLEAFFAVWTRKEAYMKARGWGFYLPPDAFDVTVAPDAPPQLLADRQAPAEALRWRLHDLAVGTAYRASLCVSFEVWAAPSAAAANPLHPPGAGLI